MYADQWWAIVAEDSADTAVVVQCDRVEDGLTRIWRFFADEAGHLVRPRARP
jgi:hypothetical protein